MTGEARAIIKMAICRHEVWLVPDMALFRSMRDHKFTIRCKECGLEDSMEGWEIKEAMARMMKLPNENDLPRDETCPFCEGQGIIHGDGYSTTCDSCRGTGKAGF